MLLCLGGSSVFAQSVTLTWNPSSDTNAVGYKVYCGVASGVYTNAVAVGNTTTATISGLAAGVTYYFSATTVDASGIESPFSNEATFVPVGGTNGSTGSSPTPPPVSQPPTLNAIANASIYQNSALQTVNLTGISAGNTGNATVNVSAVSSDNGTIITTPAVNFSNPSSTGTVTFSPVATGTATVTVTVNNGGASNNAVSQTFTVTVAPVVTSAGPSVNPISGVTVYQNSGAQTIPLAGITAGTAYSGNFVQIWAYTSDTTIIPTPMVNYNSPNNTGSLSITPVAGALGTVTVTITVNNGAANFNQTFTVTVVPAPATAPSPAPTTNSPPTLNAISNVTTYQNAGLQTINLAGISAGTSGNPTVNIYAGASDSGALISTPAVNYTNSNSTGTLTFTPVSGATGTTTVTVIVDNGGASNNPVLLQFTVTVLPVVTSAGPAVDPINNLTIYQNSGIQTVSLTGITAGTNSPGGVAQVWAYTSDSTIIPPPAVNYNNPNSTGSLTFTPVPGALGTATITVTVNNGAANFNQVFTVTVLPASVTSPVPTLNVIPNVTVYQNAGVQTISLAGITSGSTNQTQPLVVSASSSNPAIISAPVVNYTSPNSLGTLAFAPATNALGSTTVTVTVNNGAEINNPFTQAFTVTVVARPAGSLPPTINPISSISVVESSFGASIPITGISSGVVPTVTQGRASTPPSQIRITATSSNPRLVESMVRYSSPSSSGVLTLRPSTGTGTAIITVPVNNGTKTNNITTQSFTVTVLPLQPPTLDPIGNVTITENSGPETIVLTGITAGVQAQNEPLRFTVQSNNPRGISQPQVQYKNLANTASLIFKPSRNFTGTATLNVTVNNGNRLNASVRQLFTVTVVPPATNTVVASSVSTVSMEAPKVVTPPDAAATLTTIPEPSGLFGFQVTGIPGGQYVVQASSDLTHWTAVQTNTAPFVFQDTTTGSAKQFYRAYYSNNN